MQETCNAASVPIEHVGTPPMRYCTRTPSGVEGPKGDVCDEG